MTFDPYAELDVARNASSSEVHKAYRRRAKKAHPDAGGSPEEFGRLGRALSVLSDPRRRKTYDETGRIEDEKPDNRRAEALQLLEQFMQMVVMQFIKNGSELMVHIGQPNCEHLDNWRRCSHPDHRLPWLLRWLAPKGRPTCILDQRLVPPQDGQPICPDQKPRDWPPLPRTGSGVSCIATSSTTTFAR